MKPPVRGRKSARITEFKPGDEVWVRGIVSMEVADWVQVWFNNDRHAIYIEDKTKIRRAQRRNGK